VPSEDYPDQPLDCHDGTGCCGFHNDRPEYTRVILSGAARPRELMSETAQKASALLPLTYVVYLLRGLWMGQAWGDHLLAVGVLVGMPQVGIIVSVKTFRWE